MGFFPYQGFIFKWLLFQWHCLCSFAKFRGYCVFLFPPNLIKSCVFTKAVTGGLYQCLGHAAIPGCTSGFWRRKRKCKAERRTSAEVRHFQTHQPHIADCSVNLVWHKTRGFIYSRVHIGVLGQGGTTQSLNGRGVKQVVRMDKIRPKTVICLLLCPRDGYWATVREGLMRNEI